jgi:hypothetical protein
LYKCHPEISRMTGCHQVINLGTTPFVNGVWGIPEWLCKTKQDSAGYARAGLKASGISFN